LGHARCIFSTFACIRSRSASVKPALDILLARTATHPHSLGLLVEDDPARVTLLPRQERVSERRFCRTTFLIEATP